MYVYNLYTFNLQSKDLVMKLLLTCIFILQWSLYNFLLNVVSLVLNVKCFK